MVLPTELPTITDEDIHKIDFFHDFIVYLNHLKEKPIKQTATGNISLSDIKDTLHTFKTIKKVIEEHEKFNWALRSEDNLHTLTQIKVISNIMRVTQNRKGYIRLTKKGAEFLTNLSPLQQYEQIVLTYWQEVNWDYFSYGFEKQITLCESLQEIHGDIWHFFLQKGTVWIDYITFCRSLCDYFKLNQFLNDEHPETSGFIRYYEIELDLFHRNLVLFGCIEIQMQQSTSDWGKHFARFKPTLLGLYMFSRDLHTISLP